VPAAPADLTSLAAEAEPCHCAGYGQPLVENFITGDYKRLVQLVLTDACNGTERDNLEFPLVTKDNNCINILLNATTRRDANGKVAGVVGVGQDITKMREVMAHSKSVADDLTRLIDTANAPILGVDTSGNVTEWNRMASKITNYDAWSVMGKPFVKSFIRAGHQDAVSEIFHEALKGNEITNFELLLYTSRGEKRDILLNATARHNANGEVIGVFGVGQDITELNIQRRETKRIAADLQRLIDTANAPIFKVNIHATVTEWNLRTAELSGYTEDEAIGKRLVETLGSGAPSTDSSDFEFPFGDQERGAS